MINQNMGVALSTFQVVYINIYFFDASLYVVCFSTFEIWVYTVQFILYFVTVT